MSTKISSTLAEITITIYAPGFTMNAEEMDAEIGAVWITQSVIDSWINRRRSWQCEEVGFNPYDIAREMSPEEKKANPSDDYIFTDWAMHIDIKPIELQLSSSDYWTVQNWLEEEIWQIGLAEVLKEHIDDILEAACGVTDGLFKKHQGFPIDPEHTIKFLSRWMLESWTTYVPGEPTEYDSRIWFDGRIDPASLKVLE